MLRNGCFGSAITAQGASPTCQVCPERVECFRLVEANAARTVERASVRMRVRGAATEEIEAVAARITRYLKIALLPPRTTPLRKLPRIDGLRLKLEEQGILLAPLKERQNPFRADCHGPLFHMAQFICEGVPFTPKDMAEHLHDAGCSLKKSSAASEISRFVGVLLEDGILVRKERHILCLA